MSQKYTFPEWARNQVVYEVNLRQYTPGGTIKEFRQHLLRLKELGAGILWFMPIQPVGLLNRKGTLGSYYSISDYCKVDPAYGTMAEFIEMVDEIHSMGMYVILDWVANHTAWDHHWVEEFPAFYRRNEVGEVHPPFQEWEDVIGLDYSNADLHSAMISCMKFWIESTGLDGFRCDMAHLVPTVFWNEARAALNAMKPVFMLAEAEERELVAEAFDVLYNWNLMHVWDDMAHGKYSAPEIRWRIQSEITDFPAGSDNLMFISNHDENSWNGSETERLGPALEAFAVLIFTLPGMPLLYSGMEAGNNRRLSFFDKDYIEWKQDKMAALYTRLAHLRIQNPALWSLQPKSDFQLISTDHDQVIFCFSRESAGSRVLVALNLSIETVDFRLTGEGYQGRYTDLMVDMPVLMGDTPCFSLGPWGFKVWVGI
ncbi:MAG: alpha-amylase family glycosyl hydrolase [Bacteroidota bacterium]